jgi:hypothetical protein
MTMNKREELREKVANWIKEDQGYGGEPTEWMYKKADTILALFEESDLTDATLPDMPTSKRTVTLNDSALTDAALYGSPSEEQVREALKDARVCLIAAGFAPTEQYGIINQIDAALSRSAPAKAAKTVKRYSCIHCNQLFPFTGQGWADCMNHQQNCGPADPGTFCYELSAEQMSGDSVAVPPAKDAEPPTVTVTQPPIDFVLDLSQAETDRLGPPAPKQYVCEGCGLKLKDGYEGVVMADGVRRHSGNGIWCGPVEMGK